MTVDAKICGINAPAALQAAIGGGARFIGLVFYPPSPRALEPDQAAALARMVPDGIAKVGLLVDIDDARLDEIVSRVPLDILQLHGGESPERVAEIKAATGLPAMKAIKVAGADDIAGVDPYIGIADWLLFDAKAPSTLAGALPGGNALKFDWALLGGRDWACPWMLSGGLTAENVAEAVAISGARAVDVSSGVERSPGAKDPARIATFLETVARL